MSDSTAYLLNELATVRAANKRLRVEVCRQRNRAATWQSRYWRARGRIVTPRLLLAAVPDGALAPPEFVPYQNESPTEQSLTGQRSAGQTGATVHGS